MKKTILNNKLSKARYRVYLALILLLIGIIVVSISFSYHKKIIENLQNCYSVTDDDVDAKLFVNKISSPFASYYDDEKAPKFFFVTESSGYSYIAYLDNKTYEKFMKVSSDDLLDNPVVITGKTHKITTDISDIAINIFKESVPNYSIDYFNKYYGYIYLDSTLNINDPSEYVFLIGIIILLSGILFAAKFFVILYKNNKTIKNIDSKKFAKLCVAVKKSKIFVSKKNFYLTDKAIVSINKYLVIIFYKDIIYFCRKQYLDTSIITKKLYIYTSNYCYEFNLTKADDLTFDSIYNDIKKYTNNIDDSCTESVKKSLKCHKIYKI